MFRFLLYAVLVFFVIQMIRTTMRIRSNAKQWKGEDEDAPEKPPTLNIPDIEDAKFEDIANPEERKEPPEDSPKEPPGEPPPTS